MSTPHGDHGGAPTRLASVPCHTGRVPVCVSRLRPALEGGCGEGATAMREPGPGRRFFRVCFTC